jgi:hypothetical protein
MRETYLQPEAEQLTDVLSFGVEIQEHFSILLIQDRRFVLYNGTHMNERFYLLMDLQRINYAYGSTPLW